MKKKSSKMLIIIATIIVVLLGIIISNVVLNKVSKTKYEEFNSVDKEMFGQLSKIYKEFNDNSDKLWNDKYKFNEKPIILVRANKDKGVMVKYAYAINVDGIENSMFAEKMTMPKSLSLPSVYRLSKFDTSTIPTWMPSNFGTLNINNKDVFYFKYNPKMIENPDLYFDFSSFLLHESFHVYNQENWTYDKNDGEYIENYPVNKENYALMGLEFKLLDKGMETNNKEEAKQYLKQWTTIRAYKYKKYPQLLAETNTEAIEGTARYIEYKYSDLTGGKLTVLANETDPYHITFMQAYDYIANDQAKSPAYLERPMRYEVGSALGLIMDKANINWKSDIEYSKGKDGETQYEILKKHFNISDKGITQDKINQIKEENNYNELLKQGQKIVDLVNRNN